ncbi:MAG: translation elongation factor Ts [Phycisphaerae bacterium]|nr:translation elongation factor Ts [Phycisphaerae bacterium]
MADISAASVMKLRKMSGQGMMDCKNALTECGGNLEEAMALLRKKGLATLQKRAGRETSEGRVICNKSQDGKIVAMATLCCETDFVAKSDDFIAAADVLTECTLLAAADTGADVLLNTEYKGRKFSEILTDTVSKTGEKTEIGEFVRYRVSGRGVIGTYVHFNNKVGAMVEIETSSDDVSCAVAATAIDIAMHITAINPAGVDPADISPDVIEKERAIAAEQVKNKPANIIDKIVDGKIAKFFKDNCLVEQPFVKDDSKTVGQALADVAKKAGGEAKIKRFVRLEIS